MLATMPSTVQKLEDRISYPDDSGTPKLRENSGYDSDDTDVQPKWSEKVKANVRGSQRKRQSSSEGRYQQPSSNHTSRRRMDRDDNNDSILNRVERSNSRRSRSPIHDRGDRSRRGDYYRDVVIRDRISPRAGTMRSFDDDEEDVLRRRRRLREEVDPESRETTNKRRRSAPESDDSSFPSAKPEPEPLPSPDAVALPSSEAEERASGDLSEEDDAPQIRPKRRTAYSSSEEEPRASPEKRNRNSSRRHGGEDSDEAASSPKGSALDNHQHRREPQKTNVVRGSYQGSPLRRRRERSPRDRSRDRRWRHSRERPVSRRRERSISRRRVRSLSRGARSRGRRRVESRERTPLRYDSLDRRDRRRSHSQDSSKEKRQATEEVVSEKMDASEVAKKTKPAMKCGWDSMVSNIPGGLATMTTTSGGVLSLSTAGIIGTQHTPLAQMTPISASSFDPELNISDPEAVAMILQAKATSNQAARIYVGALDYSLMDSDIRQVFGAFGKITSIEMPREGARSKGFCFIEYADPTSAELALATMQDFTLKGRQIKVGRPTASGGLTARPPQLQGINTQAIQDAVEQMKQNGPPRETPTTAVAPMIAPDPLATQAAVQASSHNMVGPGIIPGVDPMNRIYIDNVPQSFSVNDVREIFNVFGTILSLQLIPSVDQPQNHRGYGFLEYATQDQAKLAIETMNGFDIQGTQMRVNYASQVSSQTKMPGPVTNIA